MHDKFVLPPKNSYVWEVGVRHLQVRRTQALPNTQVAIYKNFPAALILANVNMQNRNKFVLALACATSEENITLRKTKFTQANQSTLLVGPPTCFEIHPRSAHNVQRNVPHTKKKCR